MVASILCKNKAKISKRNAENSMKSRMIFTKRFCGKLLVVQSVWYGSPYVPDVFIIKAINSRLLYIA